MITVICPVFNEAAYIKSLLDFFARALPAEKELILVDGNSTDATCDIIDQYKQQHPHLNIRLLQNPDRYVPFALNKAIPHASGDLVVRLDAHTDYDLDYFERIIDVFERTNADIVGGPMRIAAGNNIQNAIGYATSTIFGVGNSSFHFEDYEGVADSVYLGAWKKNIFDKTGLFDTSFKRNQDDEFHYRAKSLGFTVYQHPSIKLYYHPRKNLSLLFKQYFEYGLYKPLVLKKIRSAFNLRHIIPSLFSLYLLALPFFLYVGFYFWLIPLFLYLVVSFGFTLRSRKSIVVMLLIPAVYFIIHIAYGIGFIGGLFINPAKRETTKKQLVISKL
jgi:succinoglycan biosynthesis protein ExoA